MRAGVQRCCTPAGQGARTVDEPRAVEEPQGCADSALRYRWGSLELG